jgi:arylsulfatase A-like enzyme
MKNNSLYALIFVAVISINWISCSSKHEVAERTRPNILMMIADDWSYPHASVYGDGPVETTTFDRVAHEGVLFTNAFCNAPSCTASRAALLTGMYPHQLDEGVNLWGSLPIRFPTYASVLTSYGYSVGYEQKGWEPGNFQAGGYEHNPAGKQYENFANFYDSLKKGQPI